MISLQIKNKLSYIWGFLKNMRKLAKLGIPAHQRIKCASISKPQARLGDTPDYATNARMEHLDH